MSDVASERSPIGATSSVPCWPPVLLIGDDCDPELAPIAAWVAKFAGENLSTAPDIGAACALILTELRTPDLIIVLQSWSDQFSPTEVLELLSRLPLARIVCVCGAACDSDGRTRASWPLAVRARTPDAISRIEREFELLRSASSVDGPWPPDQTLDGVRPQAVPWTASRAEIFESDFGNGAPPLPAGVRLVVESPDRAWKAMLERALGTVPQAESAPAASKPRTIVLVDVDPWTPGLQTSTGVLKAGRSGARVIACTGTLATDHLEGLKSAGADAVWFKLSSVAALRELICSFGTG